MNQHLQDINHAGIKEQGCKRAHLREPVWQRVAREDYCQIGDRYLVHIGMLPARHIVHTRPEQYQQSASQVIHKTYHPPTAKCSRTRDLGGAGSCAFPSRSRSAQTPSAVPAGCVAAREASSRPSRSLRTRTLRWTLVWLCVPRRSLPPTRDLRPPPPTGPFSPSRSSQ